MENKKQKIEAEISVSFANKYLNDLGLEDYQKRRINRIYDFVCEIGNNEDWQIATLENIVFGIKRKKEANNRLVKQCVISNARSHLDHLEQEYALVINGHKDGDKEKLKSEITRFRSLIVIAETELR